MLTYLPFDPAPRRAPTTSERVTVNLRRLEGGMRVPAHAHDWAQIAYPFRGGLEVRAAGRLWVVPPLRAVWIPPRVEHAVTMLGAVELRTVYVAPEAVPQGLESCVAIAVSDLLRALFESLLALAADQSRAARRRRELMTQLLLAEVAQAPALPLGLPMPRDRRLQAVCRALAQDPASALTLDDWAGRAGASTRTLSRLFEGELNMGFGAWRQQLRLARSMELLSRGLPLSEIAQRTGYAGQSAFSAMFKRAFGVSPRQFMAGVAARREEEAR